MQPSRLIAVTPSREGSLMTEESWAYAISQAGAVCTVAVSGEVDMAAREKLRDVLAAEVDRPGTDCVQVDLAEVSFLDSSGIAVLVIACTTAQDLGRQLVIVRPRANVRWILEVTGVLPLLTSGRSEPASNGA
jgi:anti-anti-sigma factor